MINIQLILKTTTMDLTNNCHSYIVVWNRFDKNPFIPFDFWESKLPLRMWCNSSCKSDKTRVIHVWAKARVKFDGQFSDRFHTFGSHFLNIIVDGIGKH